MKESLIPHNTHGRKYFFGFNLIFIFGKDSFIVKENSEKPIYKNEWHCQIF